VKEKRFLGELPDQVEKWPPLNVPPGVAERPRTMKAPPSVGGTVPSIREFFSALLDYLPSFTFFTLAQSVEFINSGYYINGPVKELVGFNKNRVYLLIQNRSAVEPVYVSFGNKKDYRSAVEIPAGGNYEPIVAPISAVYVSSSGVDSANVIIVEGVRSSMKRDKT